MVVEGSASDVGRNVEIMIGGDWMDVKDELMAVFTRSC